MSNKLLIAAAALITAGFAALFGGVLAKRTAAPPDALAAAQSAEDFKAGFALNASTTSLVQSLQATLHATPKDEHSWVLLGLAYQQRARETGDPAYYTKSGGALDRALSLDPKDPLVFSGLGSLALSRHRFATALTLGRQARALAPATARNFGVIGDAEIELGRYRLAFRDFDTMDRLRPDLSSYARISYGRELLGHTPRRDQAMKLAIDAATDTREPLAWTHVQLGKLYFNHGRYAARRARVRDRERDLPELRVRPRRARARRGRARPDAARDRARAAGGRPDPAAAVRRRARRPVRDHRPSGARAAAVRDDRRDRAAPAGERRPRRPRDRAVRRRPRDPAPPRARARPRSASGRARRSTATTCSPGRSRATASAAPRSATRSTRFASGRRTRLKFFHRGMIERCLGRAAAAQTWFRRALALNPHFSILWAPVARRYVT